jgi:hypothetical protein
MVTSDPPNMEMPVTVMRIMAQRDDLLDYC